MISSVLVVAMAAWMQPTDTTRASREAFTACLRTYVERVTQSRMRAGAPDELVVDYTRTMLGALLLHPAPRRIGMVGLGGGSQAKFCLRHLPQA